MAQAAALKAPFDLTCYGMLWDGEARFAGGFWTVRSSTSIAILISSEWGAPNIAGKPRILSEFLIAVPPDGR